MAVDCTTDGGKQACKQNGIKSYPTVKHLGCDTKLSEFYDSNKRRPVDVDRKVNPYMEFIRELETCPASLEQAAGNETHEATETSAGFSVQAGKNMNESIVIICK